MELLLSMGVRDRAHGPLRGALRTLDTASGRVDEVWRWTPPPDEHPGADEHAELTGSELTEGELLQCTRTSVLSLAWPSLALRDRLSHPLLTDVHHALRTPDGELAVAATGHDSVLRFRDHALCGWTWLGHPDGAAREGDAHTPPEGFGAAYPGVTDFRTIPFDRFKPHRVHPNHLVWLDGALWVTSLHERRMRPLRGDGSGVTLHAPAHDGRWSQHGLWLTTIDGVVTELDPGTRAVRRTYDADARAPGLPGWCRAVEASGDELYVGWSMLRASAQRELLRALLRGKSGVKRPTRVTVLSRATGSVLAEHPVGDVGGGTIYAIHALSGENRPSPRRAPAGPPR